MLRRRTPARNSADQDTIADLLRLQETIERLGESGFRSSSAFACAAGIAATLLAAGVTLLATQTVPAPFTIAFFAAALATAMVALWSYALMREERRRTSIEREASTQIRLMVERLRGS